MTDGDLKFGYGRYRRLLWDERDFVAELIRKTLRRGGFRQHRDDVVRGGFVVEGGEAGEFFVACSDEDRREQGETDRYRSTLQQAGWTVRTDEDGDLAVDATKPLGEAPRWLRKAFSRQGVYGIGRVRT